MAARQQVQRRDDEPAFVLHAYPYRETSLIVEAFTANYGRVALVARGAKRPRSELRGLLQGCARAVITAGLVIAAMLPFAFFASLGRGYLLPIGVSFMALILANLVMAAGWGEYFPWSILAIYAQGKEALPPVSFGIVLLTGLVGVAGTYLWWKYADQNK